MKIKFRLFADDLILISVALRVVQVDVSVILMSRYDAVILCYATYLSHTVMKALTSREIQHLQVNPVLIRTPLLVIADN